MIWGKGSDIVWTTNQMISADKILITKFCDILHSDDTISQLRDNDYDLAIVDLMYNECGLALAHHLNLPAVGTDCEYMMQKIYSMAIIIYYHSKKLFVIIHNL